MPSAPVWTRETPWRQGHVLGDDAARELGLANKTDSARTCVVCVSHDCDLANDNLGVEPHLEVIVGRVLTEKSNGNYEWAKAPRTLHVSMHRDGKPVDVELVATDKQLMEKAALAPFRPDPAFVLEPKSLATLRSWLAVRYNRAAFSDAFDRRLKALKLDEQLTKLLKVDGSVISAVYFDVDKGKEVDRSDGSPYELSIFLLHIAGDDPLTVADVVDELAAKVDELFAKKCFDSKADKWSGIHLKACVPISEEVLTVAKAKLLKQWRLEHVSFRADDEQPRPLAP